MYSSSSAITSGQNTTNTYFCCKCCISGMNGAGIRILPMANNLISSYAKHRPLIYYCAIRLKIFILVFDWPFARPCCVRLKPTCGEWATFVTFSIYFHSICCEYVMQSNYILMFCEIRANRTKRLSACSLKVHSSHLNFVFRCKLSSDSFVGNVQIQ